MSVVVLGCPRSGTTLLRRLLDAHPALACPPEPVVLRSVARLLREDPLPDGLSFGLRSGLAFGGLSPSMVLEQARGLAFSWMEELARRRGKPRWVSKTAMDAFWVDEIEELCGDTVQYVIVARHGLDVACSLRDLCDANQGFLPELHAYVARWPDLNEAMVRAWADVTARLRRLREARRSHLVRYEDLVARPQAEMDRLFAFLGEEPVDVARALEGRSDLGFGDPGTWGRASVDPSRAGRSRSLSVATRSRLAPIANPELVAHGYAAVPILPEPSPEEARQTYTLGLAVHAMKRGG